MTQPFRDPPSHPGRKRVGYDCEHGRECAEQVNCADVYTEEILREDGSCPHFKAKVTNFDGDNPGDPRPVKTVG